VDDFFTNAERHPREDVARNFYKKPVNPLISDWQLHREDEVDTPISQRDLLCCLELRNLDPVGASTHSFTVTGPV
jgi:hypothetical protein